MKRFKIFIGLICFLTLFVSLFTSWNYLSKGISSGMYLCVNVVIPSLFPVLCLCSVFVRTDIIYSISGYCGKVSSVLLHQNGYALPVLLMSVVSGYPVGASMAQTLFNKGVISLYQRNKLILIACGAGPSFVILAVGVGMLHSYEKGVILLVAHILSVFISAIFISRFYKKEESSVVHCNQNMTISDALVEGVAAATSSVINICAFTILFSGVVSVLCHYLNGTKLYLLLSGTLEVSNACFVFSVNKCSLPLVSAALGFGGLSVICQVISLTGKNKVSFVKLLCVRLLNAVVSYIITSVILCFYNVSQPVVKTTQVSAILTTKSVYFSVALIFMSVVFIVSLSKDQRMKFTDYFK